MTLIADGKREGEIGAKPQGGKYNKGDQRARKRRESRREKENIGKMRRGPEENELRRDPNRAQGITRSVCTLVFKAKARLFCI